MSHATCVVMWTKPSVTISCDLVHVLYTILLKDLFKGHLINSNHSEIHKHSNNQSQKVSKWPFLGYLSKLVIKFRMQVWDNGSMDLVTQLYVYCDTANRKTVSHFHLNASWTERTELTKCKSLGHLSDEIVGRFPPH